jgi:hypothetical protein
MRRRFIFGYSVFSIERSVRAANFSFSRKDTIMVTDGSSEVDPERRDAILGKKPLGIKTLATYSTARGIGIPLYSLLAYCPMDV